MVTTPRRTTDGDQHVNVYIDRSALSDYAGELDALEQTVAACPAVTAHRYSGSHERAEVRSAAGFAREIAAGLDPDQYWIGEVPVGRIGELEDALEEIAGAFGEDVDEILDYEPV